MGNSCPKCDDCPKEKECDEQTECEVCDEQTECPECPTRQESCIAKVSKSVFLKNDLTFNPSDYSSDSEILKDLEKKISKNAMLDVITLCKQKSGKEEAD